MTTSVNQVPEAAAAVSMTEEQFLILSGALIEINWSLKIIIVLLVISWVWGLVKR